MSLREAFKSQLKNLKKENNTGFKKEDIEKTFDQFEDDYLKMLLAMNQTPEPEEKIKELWEKSKVYFDGEKKLVGDKLVFFLKLNVFYPDDDMVKSPDINLELLSMPERRISYYEDKAIVLPKKNPIYPWPPIHESKKNIFLPIIVFKGDRSESIVNKLLNK